MGLWFPFFCKMEETWNSCKGQAGVEDLHAIFLREINFQKQYVEFENLEIAFIKAADPPRPLGLSLVSLAKTPHTKSSARMEIVLTGSPKAWDTEMVHPLLLPPWEVTCPAPGVWRSDLQSLPCVHPLINFSALMGGVGICCVPSTARGSKG